MSRAWSGSATAAPERGVPYEAVQQAVVMAEQALHAKSRAAQRHALAAASLGFQKGVAATHAAVTQQARALALCVCVFLARASRARL